MSVGSRSFPAEPVHRRLLQRADDRNMPVVELCEVLGLPRRTMHRILSCERLRWDVADRVAIALGLHPSAVWPEWFVPGEDLA